jgi:putative hydrolase of the HAD superfamily
MKYKAVAFDLFGTLVPVFSRRDYEKVVALMAIVLKTPYDDFYRLWMQTAERRVTGIFKTLENNLEFICRELKISATSEQITKARQARFDYVARALKPRKDAIKVLKQLKSAGYCIGLVSNCSTEPPLIWPNTPFTPYFDAAVFSSVCGLRKPNPRIFQLAAEKMSIRPEDCLYVGDGDDNELEGALETGMYPVLIRDASENGTEVIRNIGEPLHWDGPVITSLREVLDLLE